MSIHQYGRGGLLIATQTQKTIGLIPPVVPFNFLYSCIGLSLYFHIYPERPFSLKNISISAFHSNKVNGFEMIFWDWSIAKKLCPPVSRMRSQSRCQTCNSNKKGYKLIYKGSDPMWKLNPRDRTITLTKLIIKHAKLTPKETEIGA